MKATIHRFLNRTVQQRERSLKAATEDPIPKEPFALSFIEGFTRPGENRKYDKGLPGNVTRIQTRLRTFSICKFLTFQMINYSAEKHFAANCPIDYKLELIQLIND
ncbi:unnamed protein product [Mucor hiemalis]